MEVDLTHVKVSEIEKPTYFSFTLTDRDLDESLDTERYNHL